MKWVKPCEQDDSRTVSSAVIRWVGAGGWNVAGAECKRPGSGRGASPKAGID
jgi:hypothetical protein